MTLNGELVTTYTGLRERRRGREGHIGLQNHTGKFQFRNVLIRSLPSSSTCRRSGTEAS